MVWESEENRERVEWENIEKVKWILKESSVRNWREKVEWKIGDGK